MASIRTLKNRIRSVKNTKQITKAMQMVSASKMRRAEEADKASSPYTLAAHQLLTYLAGQGATKNHAIFTERPIKKRLVIAVASDKGLAGGYNANVIKRTILEMRDDAKKQVATEIITVGRKASQALSRIKDVAIVGSYEDLPDQPNGSELHAVLRSAYEEFRVGNVDAVDVVYTQFISGMNQKIDVKRVLPAGFTEVDVPAHVSEAEFEPDTDTVLEAVTYRLVGAQIFQCYLDARASEHAQRMVAMKNATDNASDLVDDLTLAMNKARQGAITQELAEISGGAEAMQ